MAYYTALITAWNSSIQPPTGVTGTGLSSAQTTIQKLANVNNWTITGTVPTSFLTTGSALTACINFAEFNTLTAAQQSNVLALCNNPGQLLAGSTNAGLLTGGMFVTYFSTPASPTIAKLTALAKATITPWWQGSVANSGGGLSSPVTDNDLAAAGGLT